MPSSNQRHFQICLKKTLRNTQARLLSEIVYQTKRSFMTTFDLKQAADFLKVHPETMRQMAKDRTVAGAKIGRRWVFIKEHLVNPH
jgi:hypothetical protein